MSENETVAGQEKKQKPALCGDCEYWNKAAACDHKNSDRKGGRVCSVAAACKLFKRS